MELEYNKIMTITDSIDEFVYRNRKSIENDSSTIVKSKLANSLEVANEFKKMYFESPLKALIYLVCDKYNPTSIKVRHISNLVPDGTLGEKTVFVYGLIQKEMSKELEYIYNTRVHKSKSNI